jgi:uncharacterized membrane protein YraQ (UPF0718 family)
MIEYFSDWLVYTVIGLDSGSRLGQALHFFVYDSVKILLLLFFMISIIGVFRTYVSPNQIRKWMGSKTHGLSYLAASLFGVVTPFCSCSSIPIFMSFIKAGMPLGPTFSFLVTSPLINEYLVVLMMGFFGLKITGMYVFFGILLGVAAGVIASHIGLEKHLVEDFKNNQTIEETIYNNFKERIRYGLYEAKSIVKKLWAWVLFGVGIGAVIHGFIPEETIQSILDSTGPFSVPLAALIGIPIYANCSAVVPIAVVLFQKGVPLGTALAFMMATAALSLPEAIILRRIMKLPLIVAFFSMVGAGIILIGYLLNMMY